MTQTTPREGMPGRPLRLRQPSRVPGQRPQTGRAREECRLAAAATEAGIPVNARPLGHWDELYRQVFCETVPGAESSYPDKGTVEAQRGIFRLLVAKVRRQVAADDVPWQRVEVPVQSGLPLSPERCFQVRTIMILHLWRALRVAELTVGRRGPAEAIRESARLEAEAIRRRRAFQTGNATAAARGLGRAWRL